MNDFLEKIRSGNNEEKKTWLIILSGVSMIVVIVLWIFYMNAVVFKSPSEFEAQEVKVNFWPIFKTGVSVTANNIFSEIKDKASYAITQINEFKKELYNVKQ